MDMEMKTNSLARSIFALCVAGVMTTASMAIAGPNEIAAYQRAKLALEVDPYLSAIPDSVLIKFKPGTSKNASDLALAAVKARPVRSFSLVPGLTHAITKMPLDKAIQALSLNPRVEYAEPDYVQRALLTPNDTYFGLQWGLHNTGQSINGINGLPDADIDMPESWDITTGGAGCIVAVLDTGTQWVHADLDANIWSNTGEIAGNGIDDDGNGYVDDVRGWDFYSRDNNPDDADGHGTHTAGTIAAEGNNGTGVTGVAWNCKIMPLRFLGPNGGSTADAISALNYAVAKGVKVSNNSWGGGGYSSALYNAIANTRGIGHVFVAAAGNDGINTDSSPSYPASYDLDNIISVAAMDNNDSLASFSNYGATTVDLGAPGVDIASTYPGGYAWMSGTSMAAPQVAGVAALVYLMNPDFTYAQVVNRILSTTRPVGVLSGASVTGGVLNAYLALSTTEPPSSATAPLAPDGVAAQNNRNNTATVAWRDNSDNEDSFQIERQKKNRNGTWGSSSYFSGGQNVSQYLDKSGSGTFRYRVQARNSFGDSTWSIWAEVTVTRK
ncbi:MAG TPA: S8 family serine peptidase [Thiobacillus sp.]|nr:MAG: hypothetical protein B7X81_13460 [Hydrogenophilales bacterium 17-61-76]HQT32157.1 S8 family serine peptidase [Thiobacillus sp.]HQT71707.1 S8 family serine peptidase [Thiobacillus sp.]